MPPLFLFSTHFSIRVGGGGIGGNTTLKVLETSSEEIASIEKEKKIIFAAQPHGVMSVAGICSAINYVSRKKRGE